MIENRGPEAIAARAGVDLLEGLSRLPALVRGADSVLTQLREGGVKLHPETVAQLARHRASPSSTFTIPLALAVGLLVGLLLG
jgi:ubiquinone biosynthesis protein